MRNDGDLPPHAVIVVFIGLPGAGKSSLARSLARKLEGIGFEGEALAVGKHTYQVTEVIARISRYMR